MWIDLQFEGLNLRLRGSFVSSQLIWPIIVQKGSMRLFIMQTLLSSTKPFQVKKHLLS